MYIVLIIIMVVMYFYFSSKVQNLEYKVSDMEEALEKKGIKVVKKETYYSEEAQIEEPKEVHHQRDYVSPIEHVKHATHKKNDDIMIDSFFAWLVKDWLVKLGGFIVLLGALFFLSLAYNSFGESGKVTLGFVVSAAIMAFGYWRAKNEQNSGLFIFMIGSAIATFVAYAGVSYYEILTFTVGTAISVLISFLVMFIGLIHNNKYIAILSTLLTLTTPVIFSSGSNDYLSLFVYLLAATVAIIWVVVRTGWVSLQFIGLTFFTMYTFTAYSSLISKEPDFKIFAVALSVLLVNIVVNVSRVLRSKKIEETDLYLNLVVGALLMFWINFGIYQELKAPLLLVFSSIAIVSSYVIFNVSKLLKLFYIHATFAVVALFTALGYMLDGNALVLSYTLLGLLTTILTHFLIKDRLKVELSYIAIIPSIYLAVPIFFSVQPYLWKNGTEVFPTMDIALLCTQAALILISAIYYYVRYDKNKSIVFVALGFFGVMYLSGIAFKVFEFNYKLLILLTSFYSILYYYTRKYKTLFSEIKISVFCLYFITSIISFILVIEGGSLNYLVTFLSIMLITFVSAIDINKDESDMKKIMLGLQGLSSMFWIWEVTHWCFANQDVAGMVSICIYAVIGYIVLYQGYTKASLITVRVGQVILGAVAVRVILVDAWIYSVEIGVMICMIIGAILVATTFVVKDIKLK